MNHVASPLDPLSGPALSAAIEAEKRSMSRKEVSIPGRLAYGGLTPGMLQCNVVDLTTTGVCVETHATMDEVPELLSIEFSGIYCRARRCWAEGNKIGLEFIFDELQS